VSPASKQYYGKYRGTVLNPIDPLLKGRVFASVSVGGPPMQVWAEACTPFAGPLGYGFYAIPPVGAGVWIEFEQGNLKKPIWTGCWWMDGEVAAALTPDIRPPDPTMAVESVVFRTPTTRLKLGILTGIATLESLLPPATPALPTRVEVTPAMVEVSFGVNTVRVSPLGVDVNNGALAVTPGP
jgi:Type VI secretion system/phage-baseplate injector OB domain